MARRVMVNNARKTNEERINETVRGNDTRVFTTSVVGPTRNVRVLKRTFVISGAVKMDDVRARKSFEYHEYSVSNRYVVVPKTSKVPVEKLVGRQYSDNEPKRTI